MLKPGDYVIIVLVAVSFIAALRHVLGSWNSGTCPGCGSCGRPPRKKKWWERKKVSKTENSCGCCCCTEKKAEIEPEQDRV